MPEPAVQTAMSHLADCVHGVRYEETPDGQLRAQAPPEGFFFTGEKSSKVGPGQYEPEVGAVRPSPKAAGFGRGPDVDRAALLLSSSVAPGKPGGRMCFSLSCGYNNGGVLCYPSHAAWYEPCSFRSALRPCPHAFLTLQSCRLCLMHAGNEPCQPLACSHCEQHSARDRLNNCSWSCIFEGWQQGLPEQCQSIATKHQDPGTAPGPSTMAAILGHSWCQAGSFCQ